MRDKSREYLRELNQSEIKDLKEKYEAHLKPPRDGFLNKKQKELLLRFSNLPRGTTDRYIYDLFYEVRERAQSALIDLQLLCEVLNEKELQTIFGTKPMATADFPITKVLSSMLPSYTFRMKPDNTEKLQKEQEWRKFILHEIVVKSLDWYTNSGIFKTDILRRLLIDTMDAITVLSTGDKGIIRTNFDSYHSIAY
ncbi:MAG: hypothetical protein ACREAK_07340 [Nitrosarchaeum sp.]